MNNCKTWINKNQNKLSYFLLIGATIGGINCLSRPDFNLILYLYLYFIWRYFSEPKEMLNIEKLNSWFFLTFSLLIDVLWTLFWSGKWSHIEDFERFIHFIVILLSWIGIGLKVFIVFFIGLIEWSSIKSSLPKTIQEKLHGSKYAEQKDEIQQNI